MKHINMEEEYVDFGSWTIDEFIVEEKRRDVTFS